MMQVALQHGDRPVSPGAAHACPEVTRRIAIALALLACAAPAAHASRTQESTFQDDNHLIYTTPDEAARTMDQLKALGADRLRITVRIERDAPHRPVSIIIRQPPSHFRLP